MAGAAATAEFSGRLGPAATAAAAASAAAAAATSTTKATLEDRFLGGREMAAADLRSSGEFGGSGGGDRGQRSRRRRGGRRDQPHLLRCLRRLRLSCQPFLLCAFLLLLRLHSGKQNCSVHNNIFGLVAPPPPPKKKVGRLRYREKTALLHPFLDDYSRSRIRVMMTT